MPCIKRVLIFCLVPVANKYAIWHDERPLFSPSLFSCEIAHLRDTFPFFVCYGGQSTLEISKLLLNLWPFCTMFCQFLLFLRLPT